MNSTTQTTQNHEPANEINLIEQITPRTVQAIGKEKILRNAIENMAKTLLMLTEIQQNKSNHYSVVFADTYVSSFLLEKIDIGDDKLNVIIKNEDDAMVIIAKVLNDLLVKKSTRKAPLSALRFAICIIVNKNNLTRRFEQEVQRAVLALT